MLAARGNKTFAIESCKSGLGQMLCELQRRNTAGTQLGVGRGSSPPYHGHHPHRPTFPCPTPLPQHQEPPLGKEKWPGIFSFVLSCHEAWGDFLLPSEAGLLSGGRGRAGRQPRWEGKCRRVLQEVCAHTEVSRSAAHVAPRYKAGCGSWAAQLRRFAVLGGEGKEEHKQEKQQAPKRKTPWRKHGNFPETRL